MKIEPLTPSFGVAVSEVDLASLTEVQWREVKRAFDRAGGLLLVRGQGALTTAPHELKRFARRFGPLEDNEKYYRMGLEQQLHSVRHREILCVGNKLKERSMMIEVRAEEELLWHCDDSFRDPQPMGSCFYCVEAPADSDAGGAATHFASGTAAWQGLPGQRRRELQGAFAVHDYNALNELLRRNNPSRAPLSEEVRRATPPVLRPLAAVHPVTGRESLYVPQCHIARAQLIEPGVPADAGADVDVAALLRHATRPEFSYAHRWVAGDTIVWDNRCTLHAPSAFDAARNTRLMWRITMHGEQISPSPQELQARVQRARAATDSQARL
eukprot:g4208.t1